MSIKAMKLALEALEWHLPIIEDFAGKEELNRQHKAITAIRQAIEQAQKPKCNPHPKAPHGFNRNASHANDRYTCECEGWDAYEAGYQDGLQKGFEMEQAQKQEPVAWLSKGGKGIWFHEPDASLNATPLYAEPPRCPNCDSLERQNAELDLRLAEQDQPPFGYLTNKRQRVIFEPNAIGLSNMPMTIDWKIPVYGSPQPQRQPLHQEHIFEAYRKALGQYVRSQDEATVLNFARAIEAAHGIKGES